MMRNAPGVTVFEFVPVVDCSSRIVSFRYKGALYGFYRRLEFYKPRHCGLISATLIGFGKKLGAQPALLHQRRHRFTKSFLADSVIARLAVSRLSLRYLALSPPAAR
jgi:hypothetical protein